jgi:hypothetical protein
VKRRVGMALSMPMALLLLIGPAPGPVVAGATVETDPRVEALDACGPVWEVIGAPGRAGTLEDVTVLSSEDAWAVGYGPVGERETMIQHWDGRRWQRFVVADQGFLEGVSSVAADDVWAVGQTEDLTQTLILHWDGSTWTRVPSPSPGTQQSRFMDVAAVAADDVWAVGYTSGVGVSAFVLHWDGSVWSLFRSPEIPGSQDGLYGVSAFAADDIWAVGEKAPDSLIEHWDGVQW